MQIKKIVFLASDCESSRWVYNAIKKEMPFFAAIIEQPVSKKILFKNRVKKIGYARVAGQAFFSLLIVPFLKYKATKRKAALLQQYDLSNTDFGGTVINVPSVNDELCKQELEKLQPDIVLVNGTRIISKRILQCTNAIFINMHVGITPKYRGVHGGYWALVNNDKKKFGVTIHVVDSGIDTGKILYQTIISTDKKDNFVTYPYLQLAEGIPYIKNAVADKLENKSTPEIKSSGQSKLWHHPTIWQYLFYRFTRGVK